MFFHERREAEIERFAVLAPVGVEGDDGDLSGRQPFLNQHVFAVAGDETPIGGLGVLAPFAAKRKTHAPEFFREHEAREARSPIVDLYATGARVHLYAVNVDA